LLQGLAHKFMWFLFCKFLGLDTYVLQVNTFDVVDEIEVNNGCVGVNNLSKFTILLQLQEFFFWNIIRSTRNMIEINKITPKKKQKY
jgi:hypothetical protein